MSLPPPTRLKVPTPDGWSLGVHHFHAQGEPWAAAWLGHAMMASGRTYERGSPSFARELAQTGIETYVVDHRGHGTSRSTPDQDWRVDYDDLVLGDIPAANALLRERHPTLPIIAVGHSMAAHCALASAGVARRLNLARSDAIVSLAGNVWLSGLEPHLGRRWLKSATMLLFAGVTRAYGRFPTRAWRMGSDDVPAGFVQGIASFHHQNRWVSRDGRFDYLEALRDVDIPVLAIVGAGDRLLAHPEGWRRFNERLPNCEMRVVGLETGLPYDPGHMDLVIDARCRPVRAEIIDWLRAKLADEDRASTG